MLETNFQIPFEIRKGKRARQMRITVYGDGRVLVTQPRGATVSLVEDFVRRKSAWIRKAIERTMGAIKPANILLGNYERDRVKAEALIRYRVAHFNQLYARKIGKISIRNQKSRWGSCSRNGNLHFNYRLLYVKPEHLDYVVVHELCHLQVFNHSKAFWAEVARACPNYRELRSEMKTYRFGRGSY